VPENDCGFFTCKITSKRFQVRVVVHISTPKHYDKLHVHSVTLCFCSIVMHGGLGQTMNKAIALSTKEIAYEE
jgi:hypothetical protein